MVMFHSFCMFTRGSPVVFLRCFRNGAGPAPLALLPHALEDLRRAVWLRLQGFDDLKAKGKVRLSWDQWEFQDPKIEVLYHIRRLMVVIKASRLVVNLMVITLW